MPGNDSRMCGTCSRDFYFFEVYRQLIFQYSAYVFLLHGVWPFYSFLTCNKPENGPECLSYTGAACL